MHKILCSVGRSRARVIGRGGVSGDWLRGGGLVDCHKVLGVGDKAWPCYVPEGDVGRHCDGDPCGKGTDLFMNVVGEGDGLPALPLQQWLQMGDLRGVNSRILWLERPGWEGLSLRQQCCRWVSS